MRKVIVAAFLSLDGVMQAPGTPEEDPTGGFRFGGWLVPHSDETTGAAVGEAFSTPFDLLLGRKTYDIFAAHWPHVPLDPNASDFDPGNAHIGRRFNEVTKYVATHRPSGLTWQNSETLGHDVVAAVRALKQEDGPTLLTQGSSELVHLLLQNDLVDELRLLTFPVVLGKGKRLFDGASLPATFRLAKSAVSPRGVVIATYERAGEVTTGSFGLRKPSAAELERRRNLV
jgi:dihydrofolate reductase